MFISFCFDRPPYLYYLFNRNSFVPNWNMFNNLHSYLYSCSNFLNLNFCNNTNINTSYPSGLNLDLTYYVKLEDFVIFLPLELKGLLGLLLMEYCLLVLPYVLVTTHGSMACPCNNKVHLFLLISCVYSLNYSCYAEELIYYSLFTPLLIFLFFKI
jgi:hypothetical protein